MMTIYTYNLKNIYFYNVLLEKCLYFFTLNTHKNPTNFLEQIIKMSAIHTQIIEKTFFICILYIYFK